MQENQIDFPLMDVSVVIPAYNAASFIAEALDSIAAQSVPPLEVIVINDGSSDATGQLVEDWIAKNHADFTTHLHHQDNRGISAARNAGIAHAQGIWIAFLDSDDVWEPNHLDTLLTALKMHVPAVAAYGAGRIMENGKTQERWYDDLWDNPSKKLGEPLDSAQFLKIDQRIFPRLVKGNFIKPSSLIVSKAAIEKIGPFNQSLSTAEDREFLVRLILNGDFVYASIPISKYRWHDDNSSQVKNARRNIENGLKAIHVIRQNKAYVLTPSQVTACDVQIMATAKEYLYVCSLKGFSEYLRGLSFIKEYFGISSTVRALNARHVIRSLLA